MSNFSRGPKKPRVRCLHPWACAAIRGTFCFGNSFRNPELRTLFLVFGLLAVLKRGAGGGFFFVVQFAVAIFVKFLQQLFPIQLRFLSFPFSWEQTARPIPARPSPTAP